MLDLVRINIRMMYKHLLQIIYIYIYIKFEDFHLLKHLVCIKALFADNGGRVKSLEIEYNEMIDLALCTPAAQYKLLLIYTYAPLELIFIRS